MSVETRLISRLLLAICERFGTPAGHLDHREGIDFRGVCVGHRTFTGGERVKDGAGFRIANQMLSGVCAPSCREWQAATTEARAYLEEHEPRQIALELVS